MKGNKENWGNISLTLLEMIQRASWLVKEKGKKAFQ